MVTTPSATTTPFAAAPSRGAFAPASGTTARQQGHQGDGGDQHDD
jgi:hypothetical protein